MADASRSGPAVWRNGWSRRCFYRRHGEIPKLFFQNTWLTVKNNEGGPSLLAYSHFCTLVIKVAYRHQNSYNSASLKRRNCDIKPASLSGKQAISKLTF